MSIEAMKEALEAFKHIQGMSWSIVTTATCKRNIANLRQAIEEAENQEPDLPPVEIGVDVTEHGTTVMAFYRRPNAVMEMFYSQFHPQPKQPKNPPIHIQNHTHTEQTGRCTSCGGALPVTGRLDRTGECDCIEPLENPIANPIANQPETSGSPMPVAWRNDGFLSYEAQLKEKFMVDKQEPVAYAAVINGEIDWNADYPFSNEPFTCFDDENAVPLYTAPPKREWVGLTDEEVWVAYEKGMYEEMWFARAIEAMIKERNT